MGLKHPGEETALAGPNSSCPAPTGSYRENGAKLFTEFYGGEMKDDGRKLEQERFQLFPHEEKAVTRTAQEHCAVSIHGSFQDLCKYSPEQPGLSSLRALPGAEVGPETSEGPSQPELVRDSDA